VVQKTLPGARNMIKLYGIPNCNKIRNTIKILEEKNIEYEFINVRKTPISEDQLKKAVDTLGMAAIFNKKGTTYRRLNLNYDSMSDDQRFENIQNEQSMIKRPLIERDGKFHVGFDEDAIGEFVK
jgi:Spx/MgsR family transcriptional regulator